MWSSTVGQMTLEVKFKNISSKWMRLIMNDLHHYYVGFVVWYYIFETIAWTEETPARLYLRKFSTVSAFYIIQTSSLLPADVGTCLLPYHLGPLTYREFLGACLILWRIPSSKGKTRGFIRYSPLIVMKM